MWDEEGGKDIWNFPPKDIPWILYLLLRSIYHTHTNGVQGGLSLPQENEELSLETPSTKIMKVGRDRMGLHKMENSENMLVKKYV